MSEYINRGTAFDAVTDLAGKASTRSAYEAVWKSWCDNQSVDELGKVICLAHLAEARVPDCPYKSKEERASAKYPCSDYEEVRT